MIFHQNASKTGFSAHKGQKGQIVETLLLLRFFVENHLNSLKMNWFLSKNCLYEIFFKQNSKAKAMRPPVSMKAGLQGRTFFVVFLSLGPKGS